MEFYVSDVGKRAYYNNLNNKQIWERNAEGQLTFCVDEH